MRRRHSKVRTLAGFGGAVSELLEKVDAQKHEGRDPGQGARPKEPTQLCQVYAPQTPTIKS